MNELYIACFIFLVSKRIGISLVDNMANGRDDILCDLLDALYALYLKLEVTLLFLIAIILLIFCILSNKE